MMFTKNKADVSIAMFLPFYSPLPIGGSEIQAKRLAKSLMENGVKICFITLNTGTLPSYEILDGIPVYRFQTLKGMITRLVNYKPVAANFNDNPVIFDYSYLNETDLLYAPSKLTFKQILLEADIFVGALFYFWKRRKEYNIIQINTVAVYAVIAALIGKILNKSVIIKDSTMDGVQKMLFTPFPNYFRRFITQNCTFVAMTKAIEGNFLKANIPQKKITRIPNGIVVENTFSRGKKFEYKCLFVGNLTQQPAKGVDILIKAWRKINSAFPQARLTIVGDGNISAYKNYINELGLSDSIIFTGKSNPEEYYLSNDIFILPSRREGMSNALMEAMQHKMTIIATDISGNQDLITNHYNGILINPNDVNNLVTAIIYSFTHQIEISQFGDKAYLTITDQCNMEKISKSYNDLYSQIIKKNQ